MSKTANLYVIFNELRMVICHTSFGIKMTELEINVYMVLTGEQEEEPHRKNIWRENLTFEEEFIGWTLPAINSSQYCFSMMGFFFLLMFFFGILLQLRPVTWEKSCNDILRGLPAKRKQISNFLQNSEDSHHHGLAEASGK